MIEKGGNGDKTICLKNLKVSSKSHGLGKCKVTSNKTVIHVQIFQHLERLRQLGKGDDVNPLHIIEFHVQSWTVYKYFSSVAEKIVHKITFNYINKLKDEYYPIKRDSH